MLFRPCIDLHDGKVKQIVGSTLTDNVAIALVTNFETDRPSSYYAALYRDDGLRGGHVIMLGPGNEAAAREALAAYPGGLQVGGGIMAESAASFIDAGASHVIVTSYVFSEGIIQWERLGLLEKTVGRGRLVLDLSCRKSENNYIVACDRWQTPTSVTLTKKIMEDLAAHCDEFLVHAVEVEGKRQGVDEEFVRLLAAWSPITVTYAGGVRSLPDLEVVRRAGRGKVDVTVGSALDIFGGTLSYREVVEWGKINQ
ncbi:MAG: phosphoribosylformimino-5-aminoimidazole carboxamide ribotide isomerase [Chitinispirillaceae bacterium]|jgi:phosphoribosylformimino-5-aminoimidazole carboxamide ribotide isomerase